MRILLQVACSIALSVFVETACPLDSVSTADSCYWIVSEGKEYDVINRCAENGGILAKISEDKVQKFITENFKSILQNHIFGVYIGVNDKTTEGHYVNYEGENQTWTNWSIGESEPNGGQAQNCVVMFPASNYLWHDVNCDMTYPALCSLRFKTTSQTIEPTTPEAETTVLITPENDITVMNENTTNITESTEKTTDITESTEQITSTGDNYQNKTTGYTSDNNIQTTKPITGNSYQDTTTSQISSQKETYQDVKTSQAPTTGESYQHITTLHTETTENLQEKTTSPSSSNPNKQCMCLCYPTNYIINTTQLQNKIQKLVEELSISKKETSQNRRKLTSASDNRSSAKGIGYVGAIILVLVGGFIIGIDALNMCKYTKSKKRCD